MRIGRIRLLVTACLATVGAVMSPVGGAVVLAQPIADFDWAPKPVVAGTTVTLTSTSTATDANTPITKIAWDLDGDRKFETRTPTGTDDVTVPAPAPGTWMVTVRVEDAAGEGDRATRRISVQPPPPPPPPPPPALPPPPPPPPPNQPPIAAFAGLPGSPLVGEEVTFVSYSEDRDGHITEQAWELNGDGNFDDATGPLVTRRFSVPGERTVMLRVTDDRGAISTLSLTISVRARPPAGAAGPSPPPLLQPVVGPAPLPRMLSPFPIVRVVGSVTEAGTEIHLLSVRAPKGAKVLVRCLGRGCPIEHVKKVVGGGPVTFGALKRLMPAGVVLEVLVHRGDTIGKYTRYKLRRNRRPLRADGCLWPGTTRMAPCPRA